MPISEDSFNDSSEQERVKRVKSEKKKEKRKLVESRSDTKPRSISVSNQMLDTFLEARKHLKIVRDDSTAHPLKINADEEVWIVQCPKSIETEELLGRKIVLPQPVQTIQSKRGNKEFECKLELTKQEHHLTVICPTNGFPEAVSVKQAGMISIRDRINLPEPKENGDNDTNSTDRLFFYPTNLKIRHPLLGVHFDNNVVIKQENDVDSVRMSPKKRKSAGHHSSSDKIQIKQEPEDEPIVSPMKKEKKRNKRPRESVEIKVEPDDEVQPSKKHKSNKKARPDEDLGDHLSPTKHKRTAIKIEPDSSV